MGIRAPQPNIPGSRAPSFRTLENESFLAYVVVYSRGLVGLTRIPSILPVSVYICEQNNQSKQASRFSCCFPLLPTAGPQRAWPSVWTAITLPSSCGFCSRLAGCLRTAQLQWRLSTLLVLSLSTMQAPFHFLIWREESRTNYSSLALQRL